MPDKQNTCYDAAHLAEFLQERLSEGEESSVVQHLDACPECRAKLERVTANGADWAVVREHVHEAEDPTWALPRSPSDEHFLASVKECLAPTDDPSMMGRLGCYEICGVVGRGSTGIVLKAFEPRLRRYVAVKMLSPNLASNASARVRFEREARAIAAVAHEHVVPIYAVDEFRGMPFLVTRYIAGGSLQRRIDEHGPLDATSIVRIGMQVASGLAAAHEQGIVHRDVKPANVMLESGIERAMVADFGLARVLNDASLTHSGAITGTPQFMSPEQAKGDLVDHRTDLFSLGSLMYAASVGRPPFRSETVYGVIRRVCETDMRPIREINPRIPEWLEQFIARLCAKDREQRFQSAAEVRDILARELAHGQSPLSVAQPARNWMRSRAKTSPKQMVTRQKVWGAALVVLTLLGAASLSSRAPIRDVPPVISENNDTIAPLSLATISDFPVFESMLTRALPTDQGGRLRLDAGYANVVVHPSRCQQLEIRIIRKVLAEDHASAERYLAKHDIEVTLDREGVNAAMRFNECTSDDMMRFAEFEVEVYLPDGYSIETSKLRSWSEWDLSQQASLIRRSKQHNRDGALSFDFACKKLAFVWSYG